LSINFCKSFLDINIIYVQYGISSAILPFYRRLKSFCLWRRLWGIVKSAPHIFSGTRKYNVLIITLHCDCTFPWDRWHQTWGIITEVSRAQFSGNPCVFTIIQGSNFFFIKIKTIGNSFRKWLCTTFSLFLFKDKFRLQFSFNIADFGVICARRESQTSYALIHLGLEFLWPLYGKLDQAWKRNLSFMWQRV